MQKLIWMDADRVFYRGLLGQPNERVLGALTVYASTSGTLSISSGCSDTLEAEFAVVAPYTPHRVASADGWVHCLLIEPEYLDWAQLPDALNPATPAAAHPSDQADLARRIREAGAWLQAHPTRTLIDPADFDLRFFAHALPRREPDPRIAAVVERMRSKPADAFTAQDCAQACGLSASRFLHLFKDEAGSSLRNFRTWKRARSLLERTHDASNLTDLALDLGYPDATHFSHAIRRFYGLKPSDIVAGSRRLARVGKS
jgi:AraC-like DNA-binding protein